MHIKPMTSLGLTLPELATTVCISGVLVAVAVPNFNDAIAKNRMTSIANQLVTALNYARSEAIKRGQQITVKHKDTTPRVWDYGWDLFSDNNGDGMMNGSDELLKTFEALPEGYTLRTGSSFGSWVSFSVNGNSHGSSGFANDTFRLCGSPMDRKKSRAIIIKMGRVRTETGTKICP